MPDYINYTFDDFVTDSGFRRWVLINPPDEQAFWNQFQELNPEKVDMLLAARQFVIQMQNAHRELSDQELSEEVARIRINRQKADDLQELNQDPALRPGTGGLRAWLRIAAVLVLTIVGALSYFYLRTPDTPLAVYQRTVEQQTGGLQKIRNTTNASQLVRLPDGSKVTLYQGSQISFPARFTPHEREVFLVGEAFFEVVRRQKQPFMVYTSQLTTQVLGTSFTVRAYGQDKEAKVIVRTGKVSVFKTPEVGRLQGAAASMPAFILTPNQQATLQEKDGQLERSLVAMPEPVAAAPDQSQTLAFEHTPVVTVFKKLEAAYGIVINYDADLLAGCELTADFSTESLFERLDLICRATESRYEVIDAQIVVHSKGCHGAN